MPSTRPALVQDSGSAADRVDEVHSYHQAATLTPPIADATHYWSVENDTK
jgi:hypothetical protein